MVDEILKAAGDASTVRIDLTDPLLQGNIMFTNLLRSDRWDVFVDQVKDDPDKIAEFLEDMLMSR